MNYRCEHAVPRASDLVTSSRPRLQPTPQGHDAPPSAPGARRSPEPRFARHGPEGRPAPRAPDGVVLPRAAAAAAPPFHVSHGFAVCSPSAWPAHFRSPRARPPSPVLPRWKLELCAVSVAALCRLGDARAWWAFSGPSSCFCFLLTGQFFFFFISTILSSSKTKREIRFEVVFVTKSSIEISQSLN